MATREDGRLPVVSNETREKMNSIEASGGVESRHATESRRGTPTVASAIAYPVAVTGLRCQSASGSGAPPAGFGAVIFSLPSTFLFEGFLASAFGFVFWD